MSKLKNFLNETTIKPNKLGKVNEIPQKPGWYWVKNVDDERPIFIRYFDGENIWSRQPRLKAFQPIKIEDFIGQSGSGGAPRRFAGPIPEPRS